MITEYTVTFHTPGPTLLLISNEFFPNLLYDYMEFELENIK